MKRKRPLLALAGFLAGCGLILSWSAGPEASQGDPGRPLRRALPVEPGGPGHAEALPLELLEAESAARIALGMIAPEPRAEVPVAGEVAPEIPAAAVKLTVLRWPDRQPLGGLRLTLIEQTRGVVSQVVVPRGGRLRLDDFWRETSGVIGLRAEGFEALHLPVDVPADGERERVALLRPKTGFVGRVVDPDGAPVPDVRVGGWWVESPRPFVNEVSSAVVAPNVLARIAPPREVRDFDVEVAQGTVIFSPFDEIPSGDEAKDDKEKNTGPPLQFIAAHDTLSATQPTTADGWFYVEPLGGAVLGQLTLFADTPLGASDVLREVLPMGEPRLPDLVLHPPQPLHGRVVGPEGSPIAGARVLVQLADGWSKTWPPLVTDSDGAFVFHGPAADLALGVELTGARLAGADVWKAESADGMWDAMAAIAPEGADARALFDEAYGEWTAPLPRARGCMRANAWDGDVELVLEGAGSMGVVALDAQQSFAIEGARVDAIHGGWETGSHTSFTNVDGYAGLILVDREWQPQVVRVSASGYHERTFALAPGDLPMRRVRLEPIVPDTGSHTPPDGPNGLVLDASGRGAQAQIVIYPSTLPTARPIWTGRSGPDGGFRYTLPKNYGLSTIHFFVLAEVSGGPGLESERQGVALGPISTALYAAGEVVNLRLEPGASLQVDLLHLLEARPYRLDWSLAPFSGAAPLARGALPAPAGAARRERLTLSVVPGWQVVVSALGATQGNSPSLDLTRGAGRRRSYSSLRYVWNEWEPVSDTMKLRVPPSGGRVSLVATGPISLSGVVEKMPWMARPDTVQIAALGLRGTWVAPVEGNGWFDFRSLPPGSYRLVVYRRPAPDESALTIQGEGAIHGELAVDTQWSRHDLALDWVGPE